MAGDARRGERGGRSKTAKGAVFVYRSREDTRAGTHDWHAQDEIAKRIAALKGFEFAGEYGRGERRPGARYLVPVESLTRDVARQLAVSGPDDLFGGVVP